MHVAVGDEIACSVPVIADVDAKELHAPIAVLGVHRFQFRCFGAAGRTPGAPHVDDDDLAGEIGQLDRFVGEQIRSGEIADRAPCRGWVVEDRGLAAG